MGSRKLEIERRSKGFLIEDIKSSRLRSHAALYQKRQRTLNNITRIIS